MTLYISPDVRAPKLRFLNEAMILLQTETSAPAAREEHVVIHYTVEREHSFPPPPFSSIQHYLRMMHY